MPRDSAQNDAILRFMKVRILASKTPSIIEFVLLSEGAWDENKRGPKGHRLYSTRESLQAAVPHFASLPVQALDWDRPNNGKPFFDHLPSSIQSMIEKLGSKFIVKKVVGFIRDVRTEEVDGKLAIVGAIHFHDAELATTLRAAIEAGNEDFTEGSINGQASRFDLAVINGETYEVPFIDSLKTWDLASFGAAGGKYYRLVASSTITENDKMKWSQSQIAMLGLLLTLAGIKGDAFAKIFAEGSDIGKEAVGAVRGALKDRPVLAKIEPALMKLEKNEDIDASLKSMSDVQTEFAQAPPKDDNTNAADDAAKKATDDAAKKATDAAKSADAARAAELAALKAKADAGDQVAKAQLLVEEAKQQAEAAAKDRDAATTMIGETRIEAEVTASRLPDKSKTVVMQQLKASKTYEKTAIQKAIDDHMRYLSDVLGPDHSHVIQASISMGDAEQDRILLACQGMFARRDLQNAKKETIPRIQSFRELHRLTGGRADNYDPERLFRRIAAFMNRAANAEDEGFVISDYVDVNTGRITASLTTGDLPLIFATSLYRQLLAAYRGADYNVWRLICEITNFTDLRNRTFQRFGGYAAFDQVLEGGTYGEVTSPTSEQVTLSIAKYGGIESFTEEMVINDDLRLVARIPQTLGEGMAIDVFNMVMNPIINNDAVAYGSDTDTLVHANHSNGSASAGSALNDASWDASWARMIGQPAFGWSSRKTLGLANKPRFLLVGRSNWPMALKLTQAERLVSMTATSDQYPQGVPLANAEIPNYRMGVTPILHPGLASGNWWNIGDPSNFPVIIVGFHNGRDVPEIVTEPTGTGSAFTADKVRLKVKLRRGAVISDHRAIDGQIL